MILSTQPDIRMTLHVTEVERDTALAESDRILEVARLAADHLPSAPEAAKAILSRVWNERVLLAVPQDAVTALRWAMGRLALEEEVLRAYGIDPDMGPVIAGSVADKGVWILPARYQTCVRDHLIRLGNKLRDDSTNQELGPVKTRRAARDSETLLGLAYYLRPPDMSVGAHLVG